MLARTPRFTCIECARTEYSPGFQWYYDDPSQGPAYWSAAGVLCSPTCAATHIRGLKAPPTVPANQPFDD